MLSYHGIEIQKGNTMIKVKNLSYGYPQKDLYNNISFTLEAKQKCAFIGSSGSGKSTLVDIIMDPEDVMYDGSLEINITRKMGYVSQFFQLETETEMTVFEFIGEEFIALQNEIASICTEMETSTEIEALLEKYQIALDALEAIGGDDFESTINSQLNLASLMHQKDQGIGELSGGEFKLIQVIKEMLTIPDLIIMDEPDVFLDFENLNGLRKLINAHNGTMLVITHNRYLLDHCFNKILHLENMEIREFDGRYMDYNFSLLQTKIELQELALADDAEILRNSQMVDRLRDITETNTASAKGRSLKARVKMLERLEANRTNAPFVHIKQPEVHFEADHVTPEAVVLEVKDYQVSFDELLLENVSFEMSSTDKVAIIGGNGTGKTTLIREIYKNNHEAISLSEDTQVAYLSQIQGEILDESNSVKQELFDMGFETLAEIKSYLSSYGFEDAGIDQKVGSLSGGEKNILQLAKISHSKANLLLLDEPTSHLDTYSQIALEQAIDAYKGAILMISHDFYSIVNCMDYVLIIEDKTIRKTRMKKFKRKIYGKHFDRDYMELEEAKKSVETSIAFALKENDFERAQVLSLELEELINQFK